MVWQWVVSPEGAGRGAGGLFVLHLLVRRKDAAERNDVEALRALLDAEPGLVDEEDETGRSPLSIACEAGSLGAVRLLLDRGADINQRNDEEVTPLMKACYRGRAEVVSYLLARGADPTLRDNMLATALMEASFGGDGAGTDHVAVLRLLLKDGRVLVDARDDDGWTALYWACIHGRTERARVLLLEGRADHTISGNDGMTPMDVAERRGPGGCVHLLLKWYEGELQKPCLLAKARAVADARECISKAAEKARARTEAEAQRAREEAAPAYLRGRVSRGEALPVVEVEGQAGKRGQEEEEECVSVLEYVVHDLKEDLVVEMMEGLQYR